MDGAIDMDDDVAFVIYVSFAGDLADTEIRNPRVFVNMCVDQFLAGFVCVIRRALE
ncbi:hypothetical protein SDC9_129429 [bioreactor metagenome]|uniref:Uncharacterized protein n=1 Tax=bioreactor metagenome TaxID=1076179 RepID=A0A645CZT6_9ZZZZ